eukprot:4679628-Pyramimonas_sp.AAC.1
MAQIPGTSAVQSGHGRSATHSDHACCSTHWWRASARSSSVCVVCWWYWAAGLGSVIHEVCSYFDVASVAVDHRVAYAAQAKR